MANFSRSELTRRKARLERRLEFLQDRIERRGLDDGRHDAAECSALQTALVLFDEELERIAVREAGPCGHENHGPGPWVGGDRTLFCHRIGCRAWCIGGEWRTTPRPEQNGRVIVPPAADADRPVKAPPSVASALWSLPGLRAWDYHSSEGGLAVHVFADAQAQVEDIGEVLHACLPATQLTVGEQEAIVVDDQGVARRYRFTQLREPWTFRHLPQEARP